MQSPVIGPEPVQAILKRRGFDVEVQGNIRDILLPLDRDIPVSGEEINEFRRLFGHASFRKVIRHITSHAGAATREELSKIAEGRIDEYIRFLVDLGVAELSSDQVHLTRPIDNIGPTLEWFIADVCQRDLEGHAAWSVKLSDFEWGDLDVAAWLPPVLMYPSDPNHVSG